ncbi:MAG: hypothetical protein K0S41_1029 [Anaerocolumna sp.]|jgi:hypothetical protein|nr:hypothetical protein [Anaerocolumna sp.]
MYIGNTSLYLDFIKSNNKVPESWIALEKYENCENFYQSIVEKHNKPKLFHRRKK